MFCVVCGKETPYGELRGGECPTCYLEKNVLVSMKDHVDVEICVHCNARRRGEIWLVGQGAIAPIVEEAIREAVLVAPVVTRAHLDVELTAEDERNFSVRVLATGLAEGVPFEKEIKGRSRVKNGTCVRCSRVQGGYYEAIVQVRAVRRGIEKEEMRAIKQLASRFIERVVADGDRNAFVLRDQEIDRGIDIYMGTTNSGRMLAKAICNEFGGKTSEHPKTVGQKDGLDLIRLTFAVKLPPYRVGDIVVQSEEPARVTSIGPKTVQLVDLRSGRSRHVERASLDRVRVLAPEDAKDAVVVSATEGELQLLDPWNYQTVTVLRPAELKDLSESVRVLKHDGEIIVIV